MNKFINLKILKCFFFILIISPYAYCRTFYVSPTGSNIDGESWSTAYTGISTCVEKTDSDDTIWIRYGTYNETIWVSTPVTIIGGFTGTESGDVDFSNLMDPSKTIIGKSGSIGIAIGISCNIRNLTTSNSYGISIFDQASPKIIDCYISSNTSPSIGGGILVSSANPEFYNCNISGNSASEGGGLYIRGSSNVYMRNCVISGNSATVEGADGGGIVFVGSSLVMENCRVEGNYSKLGEEPSTGGGLYVNGGTTLVYNSLFSGNLADRGFGSQIYARSYASLFLQNCTILGDDKAISWWTDPPSFSNCILWGSPSMFAAEYESTGDPEINYSCIQGGYTGVGNISDDPLFRDPSIGDFRLQYLSPCVDTAGTSGPSDDLNGNPRPVDIAGIGREVTDTYDMGAYEVQLNEVPTPTPTPTVSQVDPGNTMLYK